MQRVHVYRCFCFSTFPGPLCYPTPGRHSRCRWTDGLLWLAFLLWLVLVCTLPQRAFEKGPPTSQAGLDLAQWLRTALNPGPPPRLPVHKAPLCWAMHSYIEGHPRLLYSAHSSISFKNAIKYYLEVHWIHLYKLYPESGTIFFYLTGWPLLVWNL